MSTTKISVIVPIYKIEKYLADCVESLLNQSFIGFELILVNDGSPDNCPSICDTYAKKDQRVKVIHKNNGGLLSARKAGLEVASGNYVSFVDGDDWVDKYYLDTLFKLAEANGADLVVTGHFREFDGKIETIKPKFSGVFNQQEIKSCILPKAIYNGRFCEHEVSTYVWNKLFRKELLEDILFDVDDDIVMGEDAAISYAYLTISEKLVISRIPLYYYRQRHDSIVKSIENSKMEYYRLGLLMNFLHRKLSAILPSTNLDTQITYYLYSQILVRSGGIICDDEGAIIFNPFLQVQENDKVVVYSSGSFGQHLLSTNIKTKFFGIIDWIDVDYHDLNVGGINVKPLSSVENSAFDHLIIATISPSTYLSIKAELLLMGIDEHKIAEINTNKEDIKKLISSIGFTKDFLFEKPETVS